MALGSGELSFWKVAFQQWKIIFDVKKFFKCWQTICDIEKISFGVEKLSRYGKAATKKDAKSQAAAAAYLNLCPHIAPQVDTSIAAVEVL